MHLFMISNDWSQYGRLEIVSLQDPVDWWYRIRMKKLRIDGPTMESLAIDIERFGLSFIDPKPVSEFVESRIKKLLEMGFVLDGDYYHHSTFDDIPVHKVNHESNYWFWHSFEIES